MYVLDTTTRKLQIVLSGSHTTTAPKTYVVYYDVPAQAKPDNSEYLRSVQVATTNGATDVDICAAPNVNGTRRNIENITIHNIDSANVTLTIKLDDGGTETILFKCTLATLEMLVYDVGANWRAYTTAGGVK